MPSSTGILDDHAQIMRAGRIEVQSSKDHGDVGAGMYTVGSGSPGTAGGCREPIVRAVIGSRGGSGDPGL